MLNLRQFAWVAFAEAGSFILLLAAMVFKHGFDMDRGVAVIGPIHGVLFMAYIAGVMLVRGPANWSWARTGKMIAAGIMPIAGFFVGERIIRDLRPAQVAS